MEKLPKVDILLATYNGEKYLKAQLNSLLCQTYKNIRILINDDCSTDKTVEILKEYEKKDTRIHVKYNKENVGSIKNFENLLQKVESKYFMLADQDDIWLPLKVEKSVNKIIAENADLVFTDLEAVNEKQETITKSVVRFMGFKNHIKKYNDYRLVFLRNCVTGCTIISKKELINKYLPIPKKEPMVHDWWMALIISQIGKIAFLDEPTIKYRQHGKNQLGIYGMKTYIKDFDEYRKRYIDMKLKQFTIYVENENQFKNKELIDLSKKAIDYLNSVKNKKQINLKDYKTFFQLYKTENTLLKLKTFVMLNLPIIGRLFFGFL